MEPLAIGVHAVLRRPPRAGEQVLIIGGGMISYSVLAALRLLGYDNRVVQLLLLDFQAEMARRLGADEVIQVGPGVDVMERVVALTGARRHKPVLGRDVLTGGFPLTYDCVGSLESLRDALAFTGSRGALVLVGNCGVLPHIDLTALWARELDVVGTVFYGPEASRDGRHSFDLTGELLSGSGEAVRAVDALITHRFPLDRYQEAVRANIERGRFRSVKTVFTPRSPS
jgi:threonine dehydrogenase-like Zn-dependent dehydrogenase